MLKYQALPHPFFGNWVHVPHEVIKDLWEELSRDRNIIGLFYRMKAGSPLDVSVSPDTENIAAKYHPIRALGEQVFIIDIEIRPNPPKYNVFSFPVLITPTIIHPLLGDIKVVENLQKQADFENCSDEDAIIFLKFYVSTIVDGKSRFLPLETLEEAAQWIELNQLHEHAAIKLNEGLHNLTCLALTDKWEVKIPILYDGTFFQAVFEMEKSGDITMTEDKPILGSDEADIIHRVSPSLVRRYIDRQREA